MGYYHVNNIKKLRELSGYTQQQVADYLGLDKSQMCRYESGEQVPKSDNLKKLSSLFKVSVGDLLGMSKANKYEVDEEGNPIIDIDDGQVVRRQLFSQIGDKVAVISPDGIRFSSACVRNWDGVTHISMVVIDDKKLLVVRKSNEDYIDSQRWAAIRDEKAYGRKITGRPFSNDIYELMDWSKGYYYKISGYIGVNQSDKSEKLLFFELEEAEAYPMSSKARIKAGVRNTDISPEDLAVLDEIECEKDKEKEYRDNLRKEGKDPGPVKQYVFYPDKWGQYTFGLPVKEHGVMPEVNLESTTNMGGG